MLKVNFNLRYDGDVREIVNCMLDYQKENKINKQCVTNIYYLFFQLKEKFKSIKAKPVICFNNNTTYIHMVLGINDNEFIEASYEFTIKENIEYYFSVDEILKVYSFNKETIEALKQDFNDFIIMSEGINNNNSCCNKEYLNNLDSYMGDNCLIGFDVY